MSKSQSEFPSPKKLCRALHSECSSEVTSTPLFPAQCQYNTPAAIRQLRRSCLGLPARDDLDTGNCTIYVTIMWHGYLYNIPYTYNLTALCCQKITQN